MFLPCSYHFLTAACKFYEKKINLSKFLYQTYPSIVNSFQIITIHVVHVFSLAQYQQTYRAFLGTWSTTRTTILIKGYLCHKTILCHKAALDV